SRLELYAKGIASSPRINLLQGDFSLRQQFDKTWKPWRWSLALLALLGAVLGSSHLLEFRELNSELTELNQGIDTVFKRTFPSSKSNRPKAVMTGRLRQLGQGGAPSTGFINVFDTISSALATIPNSQINSVNFKSSGRINLDLQVPNLPAVDQLKREIEKSGNLTMTVEGTNRVDNAVRARLRLQQQ
ncbi:MAG: hypothetical protein KTR33_14520, partial [Gammaproteobacteria bacterium]|nr:hypothetical protein [Gammaproteobacteria bacterium]